jgi:RNA polymerase sigma-70 factor (ECF subfamily)
VPSDEALYERLLAGDLRAFDALYERYERPLFAFIRSYINDRAQAEEVLHDAFLAVLRTSEARSITLSFKAWLYRVARNLCLNRIRSTGRAHKSLATLSEQPSRQSDPPDAALDRAQQDQALQRALASLPVGLRELYVMRADGMSYEALAKVLDVPVGTVKSRMHAMLRTLREELKS